MVRRFAVGTWEPTGALAGHDGQVHAGAFSADGTTLYTGGTDRTVAVWDWAAKRVTGRWTRELPVLDLAVSADGRTVIETLPSRLHVTAATGVTRRLPDVSGGRPVLRPTFDPAGFVGTSDKGIGELVMRTLDSDEPRRVYRGHVGPVYVAAVSRDGRRLLTAVIRGSVRVWGTDTWQAAVYSPPSGQTVSSAVWSPDSTRLAIAVGGEVVFWNPATAEVELRATPANVPLVVEFSPDGRSLAVAGRGRSLELLDAATGERRVEFIGNPSVANGLAFHPSGTRLASVGVYGFIRVWDTTSGKEVLTLTGGGDLYGVAWSAGGKHLFAAGLTLRRWSAGE